jgi:hypothetical protein
MDEESGRWFSIELIVSFGRERFGSTNDSCDAFADLLALSIRGMCESCECVNV